MDEQRTELYTRIRSSELAPQEAEAFITILADAADEEIESLAGLLSEDSGWVLKLYENYMEKVKAFKASDRVALENILETEKGLLPT